MTTPPADPTHALWDAIERERRIDRLTRGICIAAWTLTLVLTTGYAWLLWTQVAHARQLLAAGVVSREDVLLHMIPLAQTLGVLTLIVAVLSTIGVFVRFRGSTMHEIQLRLAALERIVSGS